MTYTFKDEYDLLGIGFGPANISLAIALEEYGWSGDTLFLERLTAPDWQPEMLLDGADIQHNPIRDLVTPRNPQSPYGFLSFLKARGRLFEYLNLGAPYALRKDFSEYIRWAARHFDRWTAYGRFVTAVRLSERDPWLEVDMSCGRTIRARALSLAPGRNPMIPAVFAGRTGNRIEHFTRYLSALARWTGQDRIRSIAVVGASQSAVEIVLDLLRRLPDTTIVNVQRGFGYRLKDTSPFTDHAYFPDFVDSYFKSSPARQRSLTTDLWRSNYGAADADVLHALYMRLYEQRLDGKERVRLLTQSEIIAVEGGDDKVTMTLRRQDGGALESLEIDAVVLATGFRNAGSGPEQELWHPLLASVAPHALRREDGSLEVTRDYRLLHANEGASLPPIFLNGLCESTHGFGDAGSFSLLSLRSARIATALADAVRGPAKGVPQAA